MAPLAGFRFRQVGTGPVEARAGTLLALLGAEVVVLTDRDGADAVLADATAPDHAGRLVAVGSPGDVTTVPAHATVDGTGSAVPIAGEPRVVAAGRLGGVAGWAASGAMALTGRRDGPALPAPGDVAAGMHAAAVVVELLSALGGTRVALDGAALLGERAALNGTTRTGDGTVGGAGRLLRAADGWVAVSLPRASDLGLLPAWLGLDPVGDGAPPWDAVAAAVAERRARDLTAAAQELGLAVGAVPTPGAPLADEQLAARSQGSPPVPFVIAGTAPPLPPARALDASALAPLARHPRRIVGRTVVDLSALWAGPLATSVLAAAGAEVTKVESTTRPDGARVGDPELFALLDAGRSHLLLDLGDPAQLEQLRLRCREADLVVEASRPRALDQLGIERRAPWLSITAYGRTGPWSQWVGFGDDTAAAGGLVAWDADGPVFVADAAADPATGLHAAAAALAVLVGAPADVDLALREVAAHLAGGTVPDPDPTAGNTAAVAPPRARPAPAAAATP